MLFACLLIILRIALSAPRERPMNVVPVGVFGVISWASSPSRWEFTALLPWLQRRDPPLDFRGWGFLACAGKRTVARWEEILDFEFATDARQPAYWLALDHGVSVKLDVGNSPERIPLMEYVEIRLTPPSFWAA